MWWKSYKFGSSFSWVLFRAILITMFNTFIITVNIILINFLSQQIQHIEGEHCCFFFGCCYTRKSWIRGWSFTRTVWVWALRLRWFLQIHFKLFLFINCFFFYICCWAQQILTNFAIQKHCSSHHPFNMFWNLPLQSFEFSVMFAISA